LNILKNALGPNTNGMNSINERQNSGFMQNPSFNMLIPMPNNNNNAYNHKESIFGAFG
jgi:hypothetical protein